MPESVIVPPPPTINQGNDVSQIDTSPGFDQLKSVFDKVAPDPLRKPRSQEPSTAAKPAEPAKPAEQQPAAPDKSADKPSEKSSEDRLPSFLEKALKGEEVKPEGDEWPEELPAFKTTEEAKERYKRWREAHNNQKNELKKLRERPVQDEATLSKIQTLEQQNKEMGEILSRMGVETHAEFQNNIIRPLSYAWNEAARIVKDAGGDPNDLAKALALTGKAQFEAIDQIFEGMPESAKLEAHQHISQYRKYNEARLKALQDAPKTMAELHKKDLQRQNQILETQRKEMQNAFDDALRVLRDEAKVEVLQRSSDPEAKWWSEQAESIESNARDLAFKNTDIKKAMMASIMASMVDPYRKLWLSEREAHNKTKALVKEKFAAEPSLSESSGGLDKSPDSQLKDDLKQPFTSVFLREFRKSQARNR